MNFQVNKKIFLEAINTSLRAISATMPLPSLGGIKILAQEDELIMISSDSNISIKNIIKNKEDNKILTIHDNGGIVINARYISEIVRKIESENIDIEIIDGTLIKISGGNSQFKINGMDLQEYPNIDFSVSPNLFKLPADIFFEMIEQTAFACSDKDTRPILTGVNFHGENGILTVTATDSYRLAYKKINVDDSLNFNITIPAKYLNDVYHSLLNETEISMSISNQKISFLFNDSIIQTRLLDDAFPDTSKLFPNNFVHFLTINSKDMINAIDRSSFIKSDGKNIIRLVTENGNIEITTSSTQIGSSYENLKAIEDIGDKFEISFSGKYLSDAIKALNSDKVKLSFSGDLRPFIITKEDDDSIIQLISPVRTYK